jgi:hypothetical protein
MHQPLLHRLITLLCLVAFGLGQTLFTTMGVRCTDASGESRIEFACLKSSNGACLTPCIEVSEHEADDDHSSDPIVPTPCEDEPLGSQVSAAKLIPSSVSLDPVFAAVVVAVLWDVWSVDGDQPARSTASAPDRERPPDSLARLRTIILVV